MKARVVAEARRLEQLWGGQFGDDYVEETVWLGFPANNSGRN